MCASPIVLRSNALLTVSLNSLKLENLDFQAEFFVINSLNLSTACFSGVLTRDSNCLPFGLEVGSLVDFLEGFFGNNSNCPDCDFGFCFLDFGFLQKHVILQLYLI